MFSVRLTVTFYRLFPNAGSKIITERIHLKIHHALKETSSNTATIDGFRKNSNNYRYLFFGERAQIHLPPNKIKPAGDAFASKVPACGAGLGRD